jgi:ubiquinone/menaquinone biosynthesis C-methylase UbiE
VDLRAAARPTVMADGRQLPFRDGCFAGVLIDPPYTVEYAEELYGTEYPRPSHLLAEASRVVVPGCRVGFLHFLVPSNAGTESPV